THDLIRALPVITLVSSAYLGIAESKGKHLQYSKFWNVNANNASVKSLQIKLSSRTGMLMLYTPAFLACVSSLLLLSDRNIRFLLLKLALSIHFFKRIVEVIFVHKFSGGMDLGTAILVSAIYLAGSASMLSVQHLTQGFAEPSVDLKYGGVLLFSVGISGNFYHHYLLSKLRGKDGEKKYKIPKSGLFNLVICPHYLFEITEFFGFFLISQTLFSFSYALGTVFYLSGRSYATRKWYLSKFEDFPSEVKALIPRIF
ncbi:3-oxo-5-alpha-steroid 4-dehydrogenase (NADP(+)), partial [Bertholletia excelsa]